MQYKFKKPFKYGSETIETVELKEEYNAGDLIHLMNAVGPGDKQGAIISLATGWPISKVSKIPIGDAIAIGEVAAPFLIPGLEDGSEM